VQVGSDTVTFTVATDWWDSDLCVWVRVVCAKDINVEDLVPELRRIRRIPALHR
jgi:hypothetical protein